MRWLSPCLLIHSTLKRAKDRCLSTSTVVRKSLRSTQWLKITRRLKHRPHQAAKTKNWIEVCSKTRSRNWWSPKIVVRRRMKVSAMLLWAGVRSRTRLFCKTYLTSPWESPWQPHLKLKRKRKAACSQLTDSLSQLIASQNHLLTSKFFWKSRKWSKKKSKSLWLLPKTSRVMRMMHLNNYSKCR